MSLSIHLASEELSGLVVEIQHENPEVKVSHRTPIGPIVRMSCILLVMKMLVKPVQHWSYKQTLPSEPNEIIQTWISVS